MSNFSAPHASTHAQQKASHAQRTAEAKAAFEASLKAAGAHVDSDLQERAKNIHANDQALTKQEKEVRKETQKLAKQSETLEKFLEKSQKQLAGFDDFEAVHANLEGDLADIEEMLRVIEEDEKQAADPSHKNWE